jgi:hypothetical protein
MSPDISMCPGTNCPHKEKCYRFTAKPGDYQSYFTEAPIKDGKCDMYWGANAESIWNQLQEIVKKKE